MPFLYQSIKTNKNYLHPLDTNLQTITFETDTYYAFALIYKDAAK